MRKGMSSEMVVRWLSDPNSVIVDVHMPIRPKSQKI